MSKVAAAFASIGVLLLVLNALGGIVSGIWLAVIGEWWALGVGLVGLFGSPFLVSILLMPNFLFAAAGMALFERRRRGPGMVLAGISNLYTAALIAAWGIGILYFFASRATAHSIIPLLIWSYGVASGPWSFLASKDQQGGGNEYSAISTFFLQIGYVVAVALILVSGSLAPAVLALAAAMGVDWLLEMRLLLAQMRARDGS